MPSIELLGYADGEREQLECVLRAELEQLPFAHEIVFIGYRSDVTDMKGNRQAFLRIVTRNEEKARILIDRLQWLADVEFVKASEFVVKKAQ